MILVGLKSDLRYKKTCIDMLKTQGLTPVTTEQGMAVANKMGAQYMECSSKEMKGVEEIFEQAILTVVAGDRKNMEMSMQQQGSNGGGNSSNGRSSRAGGGSGGVTYSSTAGGMGGQTFPVPKKKKRKCAML